MKVMVNGEAAEVPDGLDVARLLEHLKIPGARVAVELNREIVARAQRAGRALRDGDRLEIVSFVGGG
jgi:sulfur carrier protein